MAYAASTRGSDFGLGDRFAALLGSVKTGLERRRIFKQTLVELNALSTRELSDLGLSRTSIRNVAREAAYGK